MAAETELERLVIRLMGDAEQYHGMIKQAIAETKQAASEIENSSSRIEQVKGKLDALGGTLVGLGTQLSLAVTAPLTAMRVWALAEFQTMETTAMRLTAAVEMNGGAVASVVPDYQAFAAELQQLTVIGDDSTLALIQQAESMGLTGEAAKRAAKNAIALGAAKGMAAESAIRMTIALEQGRSEMLGRMIPALRGIKDDAERAAKAQEILGKMFAVAEAEAKSFSGQQKQLMNDFGDFLEGIGSIVADGLRPFVNAAREGVKWLQSFSKETQYWIVTLSGVAAGIGPVLISFGGFITLLPKLIALGSTAITTIKTLSLSLLSLTFSPVGIIAGMIAITAAVLQGSSLVSDFNDKLAESKRLSDELIKARGEGHQKQIDETQRIVDPEERKAEFQKQLDVAKKARDDYEQIVRSLEEKASSTWEWLMGTGGSIVQPQLEEAQGLLGEAKKHVEALEKEMEKLNDEAAKPMSLEPVEALTKSLQEQMATIGKQGAEADIARLKLQGYTDAQLADAQKLSGEVELLKKMEAGRVQAEAEQKALADSTKSLTESLEFQVATIGLTGPALEIYKLQMRGATKEQLASAAAAAEHLARLDEYKKLVEQGKQVTQRFMKPEQQRAEQQKEMDKLLNAGVISMETYTAAMQEAEAQAHKDYTANFNVTGVDAVAADSLEALTRIREFQLGAQIRPGALTPTEKPSPSEEDRLNRSNEYLKSIAEGIKELVSKDQVVLEAAELE